VLLLHVADDSVPDEKSTLAWSRSLVWGPSVPDRRLPLVMQAAAGKAFARSLCLVW
jgi:hypothetical protein